MAEVLIRKAALFRAEEKSHAARCETLADYPCGFFDPSDMVSWIAAAERRCAHNQRTVRDGFRDTLELLRSCQQRRGPHGSPRFAKCQFEGLYHAQMRESEIAHRARRGADVERVPRVDQHHAQPFEFVLLGQFTLIYNRELGSRCSPNVGPCPPTLPFHLTEGKLRGG